MMNADADMKDLLGGNDGRQRIVTTNTDAHDDTPEDDQTNDVAGGRTSRQRLSQSGKDDNNQLQAVHSLSTNNIGQCTKAKLTNNSTGRSRQLDSAVRTGGQLTAVVGIVHDTEHNGKHRNDEDVVGISEETNTCNHDGADMVPAKGSFVDLGEGESASLVGVLNVGKVVVEVVEGGTAGDGEHTVYQALGAKEGSRTCRRPSCWWPWVVDTKR
jgi:hypothetical protein